MSLPRLMDSPVSWAIGGFAIGLGLGVTSASVWLLAIGLALFIAYLRLHGTAQEKSETRLFAAGPVLIVSWIVGFVVHGIAF